MRKRIRSQKKLNTAKKPNKKDFKEIYLPGIN